MRFVGNKETSMKRLIIAFLLLSPCTLQAQRSMNKYRIPEVMVLGKRPMKEIGVQKTKMDSVVLKENISVEGRAFCILLILVAIMFGYQKITQKKLSPIMLIVVSAIVGIGIGAFRI